MDTGVWDDTQTALYKSWEQQANSLLAKAVSGQGVCACGVSLAQMGSWHKGEGYVIPTDRLGSLNISHDERRAPVALGPDKTEDDRLLVSLSDEGDLVACAWASLVNHSPLIGIGVDLASSAGFAGKRGERFNHLLFTEREQQLAKRLWPYELSLGFAYVFSAKEAAFKACSAPLRNYLRTNNNYPLFDVRGFELVDAAHEKGTAREGHAQQAMDLLGIHRIILRRMRLGDVALTLALAFSD